MGWGEPFSGSYPTVWAYEQACKALERLHDVERELRAEVEALRAVPAGLTAAGYGVGMRIAQRAMDDIPRTPPLSGTKGDGGG